MQVPFFIDPAWSTLQADFDERGALCTTISGVYIEGKHTIEAYYCNGVGVYRALSHEMKLHSPSI